VKAVRHVAPACRRYYVPQQENPPLTAEQIEENLMRAPSAHGKRRKAFNEELDKMLPEEFLESDGAGRAAKRFPPRWTITGPPANDPGLPHELEICQNSRSRAEMRSRRDFLARVRTLYLCARCSTIAVTAWTCGRASLIRLCTAHGNRLR
jgi:hypothetical protein